MLKNKIILCTLILGLLLCGIGGGILFGELSELNYSGEYIYKTSTPQTDDILLTLEFCPEGPILINPFRYDVVSLLTDVQVDESLEEGTIRIQITYDPELIRPDFYVSPGVPDSDYAGYIDLNFYDRDTLKPLFQMKEQLLHDLKNDRFGSYSYESVLDIAISAAPETAQRLVLRR